MGQNQSMQHRLLPEPENIAEFRKLPSQPDHFAIPEVPEKRKPTDTRLLIAFGVSILLLVPFLIYTFIHADIDRFVHGYDKCGNVCGKDNFKVNGLTCSGQDERNHPLLEYGKRIKALYSEEYLYIPEKCVSECGSNYLEVFHRCFPIDKPKTDMLTYSREPDVDGSREAGYTRFFSDIASDLNKSAGYIVLLCFIGLGFSVLMLFLFRYFVAVVVWVMIIGSLLGVIGLSIFFWYLTNNYNDGFKGLAISFTVISAIVVVVLICLFKRIQLVIRLFKESIKVIFAIPLILLEPLLTLAANTVLLIICVYFLILMDTAGFLRNVDPISYEYAPDGVIVFTLFYHLVICVWMSQFIIGCQHMVISGSVSAYYFARDKSTLRSPIYNSFYNVIRYHLGTVAFGSLIITIVAIIKALIRSLVNSKHARLVVDCCLGAIESFLKYLSKNAYIQTAMHGQPFYTSGQRAVRLLSANALSAVAINSVGDFVLGMAKLLIVVCTILVGVLMDDGNITHFWAAIAVSAIVTAVIANCFFAVFETAIDTLFLCFCEDSCMNDGMERPYYMTVNLMQYIEDAKKTVKEKN